MKRIMKRGSLFVLLAVSLAAGAQQKQSLKDLLYSGKLKLDSNSVVRKDDDLASKIDTGTRKAVEPESPRPAPATVTTDPAGKTPPVNTAAPAVAGTGVVTTIDSIANPGAVPAASATPVKSNTKIWKEYTDSLQTTFKTELLPSKKIKKDTYFLIADYEIGTDGQVTITGVSSTPENTFLQDEVKNRMTLTAPQLAPVLDSTGKARKTKKKYSFSLTKE